MGTILNLRIAKHSHKCESFSALQLYGGLGILFANDSLYRHIPWVSVRYGGSGLYADSAGHIRTRGMKNSQYSGWFSKYFCNNDESH